MIVVGVGGHVPPLAPGLHAHALRSRLPHPPVGLVRPDLLGADPPVKPESELCLDLRPVPEIAVGDRGARRHGSELPEGLGGIRKQRPRPGCRADRRCLLSADPELVDQRLRDDLRIGPEIGLFEGTLPIDDAVELRVRQASPKRLPQSSPPVQNGPENVEAEERD